jgi:hypothetical protein
MNLKLIRNRFDENGIFSRLESEDGKELFHTLEHAYPEGGYRGPGGVLIPLTYRPKIPHGTYRCVRGEHCLYVGGNFFETFEVKKVPGCHGILFHVGNYNRDSEGCILLGMTSNSEMVLQSGIAFKKFMELMRGRDEFFLEVK